MGFNHGKKLKALGGNLPSAYQNPEVILKYIQEEVALGRVKGPLPTEVVWQVHTSPFGVIPKKQSPGKWHLIVDLSNPEGTSVDDGIDQLWCSLTVDKVAQQEGQLGKGSLMAKVDIRNAYRITPVNPEDRMLLGM